MVRRPGRPYITHMGAETKLLYGMYSKHASWCLVIAVGDNAVGHSLTEERERRYGMPTAVVPRRKAKLLTTVSAHTQTCSMMVNVCAETST